MENFRCASTQRLVCKWEEVNTAVSVGDIRCREGIGEIVHTLAGIEEVGTFGWATKVLSELVLPRSESNGAGLRLGMAKVRCGQRGFYSGVDDNGSTVGPHAEDRTIGQLLLGGTTAGTKFAVVKGREVRISYNREEDRIDSVVDGNPSVVATDLQVVGIVGSERGFAAAQDGARVGEVGEVGEDGIGEV